MSQASYQRLLRAPARGLWNGVFDIDQAFDAMQVSIRAGLLDAFNAGMKAAGLRPRDKTPGEILALQRIITKETSFIFGLLEFIEDNQRSKGGKLGTVYKRLNMWLSRWQDVKNQAAQLAAGDPAYIWLWTPGKEHCRSCTVLNQKVKRLSTWQRVGVRPQNPPNPLLICGGYQ